MTATSEVGLLPIQPAPGAPLATESDRSPASDTLGRALDAHVECLAKVIHHEAGNQSRRGQLAVAYVLINRTKSGVFPVSICDAANQPGQFFNVNAYSPRRDSAGWRLALEAAYEALDKPQDDVTGGALYFHAALSAPNRFFRSRERVSKIDGHIFYR